MGELFVTPVRGSPGSRRLSVGTPALPTKRNDAAELRERRKSMVMEIQNRHFTNQSSIRTASPNTSNDSVINPLKGLSSSQLTEHYANCVEMNAENKITTKNAFTLHLIDCMTDLLKGKKLGDFQVAGTTLDASARIYASRVDAIHSETYRVLGTLSRGNKKGKDNGDDNDETDDNCADENLENAKIKKKKRRNKFIETNMKNISLDKFEVDFGTDLLFKSLTAPFTDGHSNGLLLSGLSCYTDNCELVLSSTSLINEIENKKCSGSFRDSVDVGDFKAHLQQSIFLNSQICPSLSDYKFNDWNVQDEMRNNPDPDYAFDVDAELETIPNDGLDDENDDYSGDDNNDLDGDTVDVVNNNHIGDGENVVSLTELVLQRSSRTPNNTSGSLLTFLAATPSEYSFFNQQLLQTWRGPTHWKMHPLAQLADKSKVSKGAATKKEKFLLNFSESEEFDGEFRKSRGCILTKKRLEVWSEESITLPTNLNYKPLCLFSTFLKPNLAVRQQRQESENADDLVADYDYNNNNDKENYCPAYQQDGDDDNYDDTSEDLFGYSNGDITCGVGDVSKLSTIDENGLIVQPQKVAKININYAKKAKKIDVRLLKRRMWKLLSSDSENKENVDQNSKSSQNSGDSPADMMAETMYFCEIMKKLPSTVPNFMANNVSIPISFVCLLHLANEKGLTLRTCEMSDIEISQDSNRI